jgi:immunity protein, SdpI family
MIPRTHLLIVVCILAGMGLTGAVIYPTLPARVPIHWNLHGQVDGYGPAWIDAFLLPVCGVVMVGIMLLVPLGFKSSQANFQKMARIYGRVCVTLALMLFAIHLVLILRAVGRPIPIQRALPIIAALSIAIVGNWMGKIRRNNVIGIRTPWTLADDEVWERTHRLAGPIMVAIGLIAAVVAPPLVGVVVLVGGLLAFAVWGFIYSFRISHKIN